MKNRIFALFLSVVLILSVFSFGISAQTGMHTISVSSLENGTITVDKTQAAAGDTVVVTITPNSGYVTRAGSVVYMYNDGGIVTKALVNRADTDTNGTKMRFAMPDKNVTVYAEFVDNSTNSFSFDLVASSVKSYDSSFEKGTFDGIRFLARLYMKSGNRSSSTGVIKLSKNGTRTAVSEMGILYAKTSTFGTETEMVLENVGSKGILKSVAYNGDEPLSANFLNTTSTCIDFVAEITGTTAISVNDYTARAYIKFEDDEVVYSSERTDFAENVANRLGLCENDDKNSDVSLTVLNNTAVNTSFEGFGVVIYPWTTTCLNNGSISTAAKVQAKKELDRMESAGITKVRLIVPNFLSNRYDFDNKIAKDLTDDWYNLLWVEMLNELKARNIEVQLNLGWGTDFSNSMQNGKITAILGSGFSSLSFDDQVNAYGQLSAKFVDYLLDKGCYNITSVTVLSEPGAGWKGSTQDEVKSQSPQLNFSNAITAYGKCVESVKQQLTAIGINDLELVAGNISMLYDPTVTEEGTYEWWNKYTWGGKYFLAGKDWFRTMISKSTITSNADAISYHYYGTYNNVKESNYDANNKALSAFVSDALKNTSYKPNDIFMDETSVKLFGATSFDTDKSIVSPFEATQLSEYMVALMNNGYKGAYLWTFSDFASNNKFGLMPNAMSGDLLPYNRYYAVSLMAKYFNNCKKIYAGSYQDGCVTICGEDESGNITTVIVNMSNINKTVSVNFEKSLSNLTLNRHLYNPSVNIATKQANIIGSDKKIANVSDSFADTLPAGAVAVYTTLN